MYSFCKILRDELRPVLGWRSVLADRMQYLVLVIPFCLIFTNLGHGSIDLADEALTAGRSLSFYHGGDVFALSINGVPTFRKPPLMYVLNAVAFSAFGVNEFGLRLANAVFGFLVFVVTARAATALFGTAAGILAILLLAGSPLLIAYSREALTDTALVFGLVLAAGAITLEVAESPGSQVNRSIGYAIGLAIALVSKGLMAFILPAYALPVLFFLHRSLARKYLFATVVATIPLGLWMGYSWKIYPDFFNVFVVEEAVQRANYQSTFSPQHIRPPYWYLVHLWKWSGCLALLALPLGVWILIRPKGKFDPSQPSCTRLPAWRFLTGFGLFYFLVLSAASHKRDAYLLPVLPIFALIILAAGKICWDRYSPAPGRKRLLLAVGAVIMTGLGQTLNHYHPTPDYRPDEKALAQAIAPLLEPDRHVYTEDLSVSLLLHFYLDQTVHRVASTDEIARGVIVSKKEIAAARKIGPYYFVARD